MSDKAKVESPSLWKEFDDVSSTNNLLKLSAIHRFTSTVEAVEAAASINEGKMSKDLKKFLSEEISGHKSRKNEQLIVSDAKLGGSIAKKLGIQVVSDSSVQDLYRGIRTHLASLLSAGGSGKDAVAEVDPRDLNTMSLGLSHSLSRYKLKFSPDKVDTMVVQAIGLLDDLDKEVNIYAMRVKEWYGWHFPEMGKIITDNVAYSKVIKAMGFRTNAQTTDFSEILPEEIEQTLKAAAEISMGTEISDTDINHIWSLCDQVISLTAYRAQLYSYLQNRMAAIAPNLTALVGELVGARLISHSGSIMNLAKQPASTIQILGAEKALFRALKQKAATPKYGIVYHASLVGQAPTKMKGKMARMVATKAALSIRLDALADADSKSDVSAPTIGMEARAKLESRLRGMEHQTTIGGIRGAGVDNGYKQKPFEYNPGASRSYNDSADAPVTATPQKKDINEAAIDSSAKKLSKEEKKALKRAAKGDESAVSADESTASLSKEERKALKKAKKAAAANGDVSTTSNGDEKERKKEKKEKKRKESEAESDGEPKKKKKRHSEA